MLPVTTTSVVVAGFMYRAAGIERVWSERPGGPFS
jgi:hypothetical protein